MPCLKGKITSVTILVGGEAVTTELEMIVDSTMGGKKMLGMTRLFEPLHLSFSSSRGLVRHLGPIIEIAALAMRDAGQDRAFCSRVAAQLVGDDMY